MQEELDGAVVPTHRIVNEVPADAKLGLSGLPLLVAPASAFAGALRPSLAAPVGAALAAVAFGTVLLGWGTGGGAVDLAWPPPCSCVSP